MTFSSFFLNRVETPPITAHLRDQLVMAKNANEMFRIFSRLNVLFVRPHIGGDIREYQTQLIQRVKDAGHYTRNLSFFFQIKSIRIFNPFNTQLMFSDSIFARPKWSIVGRTRFTTGCWFHHLGTTNRQSVDHVLEACRRCSRQGLGDPFP